MEQYPYRALYEEWGHGWACVTVPYTVYLLSRLPWMNSTTVGDGCYGFRSDGQTEATRSPKVFMKPWSRKMAGLTTKCSLHFQTQKPFKLSNSKAYAISFHAFVVLELEPRALQTANWTQSLADSMKVFCCWAMSSALYYQALANLWRLVSNLQILLPQPPRRLEL